MTTRRMGATQHKCTILCDGFHPSCGLVLAVLARAIVAQGTQAQTYPSKPVRVIVAGGAGSGDDFYARLVSIKLGELLGQQFIVDNRPGAGGLIGHQFVIKSPADGYTLMLAGSSMTGVRFVNANVNYDVSRDFTPVSLLETSPFALLVHPSLPARSVKEFIALARSSPGKVSTANLGGGQMPYWCSVLLRTMARIETVDVPYKTGPAAIVDLIAGQVDSYFAPSVNAITNRNRLRVLAVTGAARSAMLPDVPTMAEAALPGYDLTTWRSIVGPAGLHRDIVDTLNQAVARALAMPDVRERILKAGSAPAPGTPEQLAKRIADSVARFGRIAKQAGIKPQ